MYYRTFFFCNTTTNTAVLPKNKNKLKTRLYKLLIFRNKKINTQLIAGDTKIITLTRVQQPHDTKNRGKDNGFKNVKKRLFCKYKNVVDAYIW